MKKSYILGFIILFICLGLTACGQSGALYLPSKDSNNTQLSGK